MDGIKAYHLETMNIELTTKCPLRCPQCYCSLTGGKDIPLNLAIYWITEAASMGVKDVMLSGGETLCYPHIYDVIKAVKEQGMLANIALSGAGFNQEIYDQLIEAGVDEIYISLNGSTKEINSSSRDGYDLAIKALALLQKNQYKHTTINWVMHSSNADDFQNLIYLAEKYEVSNISILGLKPDSKHTLSSLPSKDQMLRLKKILRAYNGGVCIQIESCFSPMLALFNETKLFGNFNVSEYKGCCAGKTTFSVNVDGYLTPCRHLDYCEQYNSLKKYIEESVVQQKIRSIQDTRTAPCYSCKYEKYCRPCLAINTKLNNNFSFGFEQCPNYEAL